MAIQHRRGNYADFDPTKMVAGEPAVVLGGDPTSSDGKAAYIAFGPGSVKKLATAEDMRDEIYNQTQNIIQEVEESVADDVERAESAAQSVSQSAAQIAQNTQDISNLKADLSELTVTADRVITNGYVQKDYSDVRVKLTGTETTGYLWNTTSGAQEANANGKYARFDNIGNYATLYLNGSAIDANHRQYAIYDSNGNRLAVQPGSTAGGFVGNTVQVPSGASYIIINTLIVTSANDTGRDIPIACYVLKPGETSIVADMTTLEGTETIGYAWRINNTPLQHSSQKYIRYNTIPESKYIYVSGMSYRSTCPLVSFYDASNNLIYYRYGGNSGTNYTRMEISIPANTAYFIANIASSANYPAVIYPESSSEQKTQADVNEAIEEALADVNEAIEEALTDLVNKLDGKKNYLQYVTNSYGENVYIWIPSSKNHYIKYIFEHTIVTEKNADVWRITVAYLCDDSFNDIVALTTGGEWECALRLENRPDFSGGRAHGDEVYSDITFIIDGSVASNITAYTTKTAFKELRILQTSALYDPDNQSDKIADHMSEHVFSASDIQCVIKQSIKWNGDYNIANCYLAMFPVSKEVSSDWYNNFTYALNPIAYGTYENITDIKTNGYNKKVWGRFGINKYVDADYNGNGNFLITDNSGNAYNKCYYTISSGTGGTAKAGEVKTGDVWQSESFYNFEYVE